jgi:hypothetical protein
MFPGKMAAISPQIRRAREAMLRLKAGRSSRRPRATMAASSGVISNSPTQQPKQPGRQAIFSPRRAARREKARESRSR